MLAYAGVCCAKELKQANCLFNQTDTREAMKQGPQPTQLWAYADVR
jgi:hypothetical protein